MAGGIPAALPVSLAEARAFLRIESDAEEALLAGLLRTAADLCEAFTGQALIVREAEAVLGGGGGGWQRLALAPVRAILGVTGLPAEGAPFALAAGDWRGTIDGRGEGWIRVERPGAAGRVRVAYTAGLAEDANGVPEPLRQGILRLAAHLFTHRDGAHDGGPPAAVTALWRPWRRMAL